MSAGRYTGIQKGKLKIIKKERCLNSQNRNKLELTWYGKDDPIRVEPRILIEDKELSNIENDPETQNMLIHGDNLLALKALEKDYSGKIKCIFIDPPYNVNAINPHYSDLLPHSEWLNSMKPRLEIMRTLLADDGVIFIQIDDEEYAYLKVLCDEIFGRQNFISTITLRMSTASGVKTSHRNKTIIKEKEFILAYAKDKSKLELSPQYIPIYMPESEFSYYVEKNNSENPDDWKIKTLKDILKEKNIERSFNPDFISFVKENKDKIWRRAFIRNEYKKLSQDNPDKIFHNYSNGKDHYYYRGREMFFLENKFHNCWTEEGNKYEISNLLGDFWNDINTGKLFSEGGVSFRNGKKPEFLVSRLLNLATKEGDLVLDSFLGSGTTSAVAHKMGRKWIGIEMEDQAYTHCKVRLDNVISNNDKSGISKACNWEGGGGYKFYELAPSLLEEDDFGELIINENYDQPMLEKTVALHEGYTYAPDSSTFWKQSKGTENSYLYVTTKYVDRAFLNTIASDMGNEEFLTVSALAFDKELNRKFKNIRIKKIPESIMNDYDYAVEDYNIEIVSPPEYSEEELDEK